MTTFYVLRYVPGTPLNKRKHQFTLGRFGDFGSAEATREASPVGHLLDVYAREENDQ